MKNVRRMARHAFLVAALAVTVLAAVNAPDAVIVPVESAALPSAATASLTPPDASEESASGWKPERIWIDKATKDIFELKRTTVVPRVRKQPPKAVAAPVVAAPTPAAESVPLPPPPKPAPPPLPFLYMGKLEGKGKLMFVYLSRNDKTYIVKEGDMLDESYRVESVSQDRLVISHLPSEFQHVIVLAGGVSQ